MYLDYADLHPLIIMGKPSYHLIHWSCDICWGGGEEISLDHNRTMEAVTRRMVMQQTCHFDLTQNLNECDKKSEYTEKNLNLTIKIGLLYRNVYQIHSKKIWILSQVIWISLNFRKKIWMIQIKSEWMAGLSLSGMGTDFEKKIQQLVRWHWISLHPTYLDQDCMQSHVIVICDHSKSCIGCAPPPPPSKIPIPALW